MFLPTECITTFQILFINLAWLQFKAVEIKVEKLHEFGALLSELLKYVGQKHRGNIIGICKLDSGGGAVLKHCCLGSHHCGHRTGAVPSSDKHWQAALEHCLALLKTYDSSTAVLVCPGLLLSTTLWPSHCLRERLLPNVENFKAVLQALPAYLAQNLLCEPWLGLHGHCFEQFPKSCRWQQFCWSKPGTWQEGGIFCWEPHSGVSSSLNFCKLLYEVDNGQTTSAKIFEVNQTV